MRVRIWAEYEVHDPEIIRRYAQRRYEKCWGEDKEFPELSEAVLEAMINSNENPGNDALGLEIVGYGSVVGSGPQTEDGTTD